MAIIWTKKEIRVSASKKTKAIPQTMFWHLCKFKNIFCREYKAGSKKMNSRIIFFLSFSCYVKFCGFNQLTIELSHFILFSRMYVVHLKNNRYLRKLTWQIICFHVMWEFLTSLDCKAFVSNWSFQNSFSLNIPTHRFL